jgi:ABC-type polysaccharide/polyol phosphate transport system ATPase subunit
MRPLAIQAASLGKRYRLGEREPYRTLRDALVEGVSASLDRFGVKRSRNGGRAEADEIWALRRVSFDVEEGEVLGIIGRNGAGKSTLLKILARITEPTEGSAAVRGRVASLLEVGTGFHPELTGRENVYLNGAILGMRKSEIDRRFDEIVDFADVERFLDTPVKRYSSGMYVRLAFAVAAHLEPEILLVDEVLAVGDAAFQKKCLRRMGGIAESGRTVIFVSHNFEAVRALCTRALLLDRGSLEVDGDPSAAITKALSESTGASTPNSFRLHAIAQRSGAGPASVEVKAAGKAVGEMLTFEDEICATLTLDRPLDEGFTFAFQVQTYTGLTILNSFYRDRPENEALIPGKTTSVSVTLPRELLPAGVYEAVFAYMRPNADVIWLTRDTWFEVHEIASRRNEGLTAQRTGLVFLTLPWTHE